LSIDQFAGLAAQQPVLALYEDVHWIDPATLELLGLVIERIQRLPVLVLITFRPEFQPPWTGHTYVTTLTMNRLGRRQGADLVARLTDDKPLPADVVEQIVARTDGVPLFVEELTKMVLESGLLIDTGDRYELFGPLPPLAIPTTLHDSLMARLDRLAPVKEVAQIEKSVKPDRVGVPGRRQGVHHSETPPSHRAWPDTRAVSCQVGTEQPVSFGRAALRGGAVENGETDRPRRSACCPSEAQEQANTARAEAKGR
jgi:hypothetical protein